MTDQPTPASGPTPADATPSSVDGKLARIVALLDRTLGVLLAGLMFAMMMLTFVDVIGRQVFASPILGSNELTQIALGFVLYLGLPLVCLRREHITIDLAAGLFRGSARRFQHVALNVVLAATLLFWARQVWIQAESVANSHTVLMFLQISLAPYIYVMSGLTFFSALLFLLLAWCYLRGANPKSAVEAETGG